MPKEAENLVENGDGFSGRRRKNEKKRMIEKKDLKQK